MKFKDFPYERADADELSAKLKQAIIDFSSAKSADAAVAACLATDALQRDFSYQCSLSSTRHSIDTTDKFYDAENDYYDEKTPQLMEYTVRFSGELLKSPFRAELTKEFGDLIFVNAGIAQKAFSPAIIPDKQEENKLATDYTKLLASAKIEFDGKVLNRSDLFFYKQLSDRAVRKAAFEADAVFLNAHRDELDDCFDKLVKNRHQQAKKLGYENFIELGYYGMQRNSWNKDDISEYRKLVKSNLVPVVSRIKALQAKRLGLSGLHFYDDAVTFPDGNAKPKGTPEEIFAAGKKMYTELSPETAEFFDFMLEHDLFDVLARPNKAPGGYCTVFPQRDASYPFIFANFNGTTGDIDVLTHEAGHAFAFYRGAKSAKLMEQVYPTSEACEVHSMSMEFFTWPWMDTLTDNAEKYRCGHLADAISFIPYGTIVDAFQHIVYENPNLTPGERNKAYLELEKEYRPFLNLTDTPFVNEGRRWQYQTHIYQNPFYYIDYCLAGTVALHFWAQSRENFADAWERYKKYVSLAGTRRFTDMLTYAGLPSPFEKATFDSITKAVTDFLGE